MIVLNGSKFAENEKELTQKCKGRAKRFKREIKIFDIKGVLIGVVNRHGVLCKATKIDAGWRFNFGDISEVGRWESYMNEVETIRELAISRGPSGAFYL